MEQQDLNTATDSVAAWIAHLLKERGIDRVFGLQGGHIQPIWDHIARKGIRIVDVRDEGAAVHMAHAHAELTGQLGVAMVTAGPGVTNCVTGIANASLARMPLLLIGGCTSRPQANMGPLQDIPHAEILRPVCRYARTARVADQVVREIDEAIARAFGDAGEPGPSYLEIPTDVLRTSVPSNLILQDWIRPKPRRQLLPHPDAVDHAVELIQQSKRPLVVTGRGARNSKASLTALMDAMNGLYLDTQESRGLLDRNHTAFVGAARADAMQGADLVITVGRKLDYQLGFGSPAVFPQAKFIRISDSSGELIDNRRGNAELLCDIPQALDAISERLLESPGLRDNDWLSQVREKHASRKVRKDLTADTSLGSDGKIHPMAIFDAIRKTAKPDYIAVADGGDLLSFARVGLEADTYLDAGAFGCLGVGVPFAIAAALAYPDRQVISVNGDGAYGINAMEIDTAVRHDAKAVFIISNNAAWNIERFDQEFNYGGRVVGTTLQHANYAQMAEAFGAYSERVERPQDIAPALKRALENAPAVIDVVTSQTVASSDASKGLGFVPDYQALTAWDDAEQLRRS